MQRFIYCLRQFWVLSLGGSNLIYLLLSNTTVRFLLTFIKIISHLNLYLNTKKFSVADPVNFFPDPDPHIRFLKSGSGSGQPQKDRI